MQKEHPIDRLMRRLRGPIIAGLFLSGPIMLLSYGWMIKDMLLRAPIWVSVIVVIAHLVTWLAIASLFDSQQERRMKQQGDQSAPPRQMKQVGPQWHD